MCKIAFQFLFIPRSSYGKRWKDIANERKNVYLHLIPHRVSQNDYLKGHKAKKYWQLKNKWRLSELNSTWLWTWLWDMSASHNIYLQRSSSAHACLRFQWIRNWIAASRCPSVNILVYSTEQTTIFTRVQERVLVFLKVVSTDDGTCSCYLLLGQILSN